MLNVKRKPKDTVKDYFYITVATVIMSIGIYVFKVPNNFIMGGVTGISVALSFIEGLKLSTAWIIMIVNMSLLVIGFLFIGKSFGVRTVYSSVLSSAIGIVFDYLPIQIPLTDNLMLEACFAVILPGVGTAIMFNCDASSGGTDIIAMIVKKFTKMESGKALVTVDFAIMLISFTQGMEIGLLSFLGLLAKSMIIDRIIAKMNNSKNFLIVTTKPKEIGELINVVLERGATLWKGQGMYTHTEKYIILVVMSPKESAYIRDEIKKIDDHAFIIVENTSDILGKGFKQIY